MLKSLFDSCSESLACCHLGGKSHKVTISSFLLSSFADTGKSWCCCCHLSSISPAMNLQEVNEDRCLDICCDFCCSRLHKHLHLAALALLLKLRGTLVQSAGVRRCAACPPSGGGITNLLKSIQLHSARSFPSRFYKNRAKAVSVSRKRNRNAHQKWKSPKADIV